MSDGPFRINAKGEIVGPGGLMMQSLPGAPGLLVLDLALANRLYMLGHIAGRLHETEQRRRQSDRIAMVIADIELDDEVPFDFKSVPDKPL